MRMFYSSLKTNHFVKQVEDHRDGTPLSTYSMIVFDRDIPSSLPIDVVKFCRIHSMAFAYGCLPPQMWFLIVNGFDCVMGLDV
uniref:Uncharacterized protein n=1 Tax=Physcomitrium patens TaxID=3218 RepID=A0A2K1IH47_PHYPA|nr:hypothetical protein PHYPA_029198 [Physcomitrium patens]